LAAKLAKGEFVITIRQVMNKNVVALRPETTVAEAVQFLVRHHIGGSPVVNDDGKLVGMISEIALIDVVFEETVRDTPVSKFMTAELHVVNPDEPLMRAAQLFALYSFRRLPVVEDGKLIGIITRRDLMDYSLRTNQTLGDPLVALIPWLAPISGMQHVAANSLAEVEYSLD
jgi:CBS domain-containing protein